MEDKHRQPSQSDCHPRKPRPSTLTFLVNMPKEDCNCFPDCTSAGHGDSCYDAEDDPPSQGTPTQSILNSSVIQESLNNIRALTAGMINLSPGYDTYQQQNVFLPLPTEYDLNPHDDLSSDEAYEIPVKDSKPSNWRKVRNIVQWAPFVQTYKRNKYPWVQLAGHHGNFKAGSKQGTILKKLCPTEEKALDALMTDALRQYVPQFIGVMDGSEGEKFLQLQDLLSAFTSPCVMDIKMGVRTYLEDELAKARENPKLRKDMYEKMVQIDPDAPTPEEHNAKAITKPRYMVWRETLSSTATLGFRIEGVRRGDGTSTKDFKTTRTREQVSQAIKGFVEGYPHAVEIYIQRLKSIRSVLLKSSFFKTHEFIGSSLLFVHNESSASVWLIDFAKTMQLPEGVTINHRSVWVEGTHEDGYMIGLDNLIDLFVSLELATHHSSSDSNRTLFASPPPASSSNNKGSKSAGS
ncbi:inositol 1,4,5-triphosphate kinase 2 [Oratosquilla oratoria]|uniref:inositol 1,4,5-triphosphate kinase 2 n=1 Tax=Oratosquilla oratoria TaxID=337810 RepID=UPI003F757B70